MHDSRLGIRTLQKSDKERPGLGPATCRSIVMCKDKLSRPTLRSHHENGDNNDDDTGTSPVNADLVDEIQITRAESIDESANKHDSPKTQDSLPSIRDKVLVEDGNSAKNKLRAREIDRQGDSPVSDEGKPAIDEADNGRVARRTEHGAPVVDTSSCRENGADLCERGGDAKRDERHQNPAPEDGDGLAVCEGDVHCRRETKGDGHDGEREAQNAEHAEVSRKLSLVAQTGEGLICVAAAGGRLHD